MPWKMVNSWMWSSDAQCGDGKRGVPTWKRYQHGGRGDAFVSESAGCSGRTMKGCPEVLKRRVKTCELRPGTYDMLHRAQVEWPCLSVDVIRDDLGAQRALVR